MPERPQASRYVGQSVERVEDPVLLTGQALYADDWPERPGTLHGALLRSPHAHAEIRSIDVSEAKKRPGVVAVITGKDVQEITTPFITVLRQPMQEWALAVDRVRFVGELVALVVADDRYAAEDALESIHVDYAPLDVVVRPLDAAQDSAPLVHPGVGSNIPSHRDFKYGDLDTAFAEADRVVSITIDYPRNSQTPLEGFVVLADYRGREGVYDVVSNFQGPFTVHPVMAKALGVKGLQLRMRSPAYSGGGFGIKQAIFPYVVLMCVASRITGRPVKWVEDRLEHLSAAIAAPNRIIKAEAAVKADGTVTGFRFDQLDDYGAYLRPPMPGPLYRQHGIMTGAYNVPNMTITNRVVMTNKTPSGMVRGFGGPQIYFAIERLMHQVSVELGMDHLEVIKKNLIRAGSFPYRAAAGALIDSGDYQTALDIAERAGPKGGNVAYATVNLDPLGAVSVTADSLPQGQGHATILSQIVADELGLKPDDIVVNMERDTLKDPWLIATGNYSSRFSSATAVAAQKAAIQTREKLAAIAAPMLNVTADNLDFAGGQVFARDNPEK